MTSEYPAYYVYILYDTRTETPFYVGKGKGFRIDQHESDDDPNVEKKEMVQALKSAGCLGKRVIARFASEAEAFAVEATLIKWTYGIRDLANRVHGRHHELIRSRGNLNELQGIDVERRIVGNRAQGGKFTEEQVESIKNNLILEKLEYLQAIAEAVLKESGLSGIQISECDISRPQDPMIRLWRPNWPCTVRLKIQLTGRDVAPAFAALSGKKEDREAFQRFADQLDEPVMKGTPHFIGLWQVDGNPKRCINPSRPSLDDEQQIADCITRMCQLLQRHQA